MLTFLILFFHRTLSGIHNGLGYAQKNYLRILVSFILILFCLLMMYLTLFHFTGNWYFRLFAVISFGAALFGSYGVEDSFNKNINLVKADIHSYELFKTGGVVLGFVFLNFNIITIILITYPGLICHKGFVNILAGNKWFYSGTNDPTGATFNVNFKMLKWVSKLLFGQEDIPRNSATYRLIFAIISLIAFLLNQFILNYELRLSNFLNIL